MDIKGRLGRLMQALGRLSGIPTLISDSSNALRNEVLQSAGSYDKGLQKLITHSTEVIRQHNRALFEQSSSRSYVDKGTQILLGLKYREYAEKKTRLPFKEVEFRNHSQNGEDGILWYIFSTIGTTNRTAIEMCAGIGRECNSANLIVNHGWHGLLFDGDDRNIAIGEQFYSTHPDTFSLPPSMIKAWITADNVNQLIEENGSSGEIDLFSLDVDGVDYWVWDALDVISPRVVVLEIQAAWMCQRSVTVPYDPGFVASWIFVDEASGAKAQYGGASLPAFIKLARKKGYRLVGSNRTGFNVFFMRNDVGVEHFPEIDPESCFSNAVANWANARARLAFEEMEWQEV